MKLKILILITLVLLSNQMIFGQEPDWMKKMKSITLLSSTRDDVNKLLGQPRGNRISYLEYYVLEGEISVQYSSKCRTIIVEGKEVVEGWNIPEWTVTTISFSPNKKLTLKKLKFDVTGFNSYPVLDSRGAKIYENDELGIEYGIGYGGKLDLITFYPANKYDNLHCKK